MMNYALAWVRVWIITFCAVGQAYLAGSCRTTYPANTGDDLPLTLIPTNINSDQPMVFFVSGDGGWIEFDQLLAEEIAAKGMPVVGLDAKKYFWKEKTPESATADISAAITKHMKVWKKKTFVLIGFSFGASIVPFVANRFPPTLKKNLRGVIAMSPNERTDFEVRLADMLNIGRRQGEYNVLAEMQKIKATGLVCFFGHDEDIQVEDKIEKAGIPIVRLSGGHHYEDNYAELTEKIYGSLNVVQRSDSSASRPSPVFYLYDIANQTQEDITTILGPQSSLNAADAANAICANCQKYSYQNHGIVIEYTNDMADRITIRPEGSVKVEQVPALLGLNFIAPDSSTADKMQWTRYEGIREVNAILGEDGTVKLILLKVLTL